MNGIDATFWGLELATHLSLSSAAGIPAAGIGGTIDQFNGWITGETISAGKAYGLGEHRGARIVTLREYLRTRT